MIQISPSLSDLSPTTKPPVLAKEPSLLYKPIPLQMQTKDQLAGGLDYLKKVNDESPDWSAFEAASGIGIEVLPQ